MWDELFFGSRKSRFDDYVPGQPKLKIPIKRTIGKVLMMLVAVSFAMPSVAQENSETGLWTSVEVEKKLDKRFSVTGEAELRFSDNLRNTDRWSVAGGVEYKLHEWLKLDSGYKFVRSRNAAETEMKDNGVDILKRTVSYRDSRHRLFASVTGSVDVGRFGFSLRERWQYTYTGAVNVDCYDYDENRWETTVKGGVRRNMRCVLGCKWNTTYRLRNHSVCRCGDL